MLSLTITKEPKNSCHQRTGSQILEMEVQVVINQHSLVRRGDQAARRLEEAREVGLLQVANSSWEEQI